MIPAAWKNRIVGPVLEPVTPQTPADGPAIPDRVVRGPQTEITDHMRDALALALHHRWHGDHHEGRRGSEVDCARMAGAFDDVAAIEPLLTTWLRTERTPS